MPLTTLFLDLNSYFASVEQQVQPSLRGVPIAVAPITSDSGCCIAASYEAKAFGVKTGTRVGDAKRLCPQIQLVDARPRLYVVMHNRILEAIDTCIPVEQVHSIDEVSCKLDRVTREPEQAKALALRMKAAIRKHCGVCMRCSIGIAPNKPLAKLATDMQKPDGLVMIRSEDLLPRGGMIGHLSAQELAGIGPRMMKRLEYAGIRTIGDMYDRSSKELRDLWGGMLGEKWYHWIRGEDVHERKTKKSSIGHQHVLAPDVRSPAGARAVAFRLLLKAAARLRYDKYAAQKLSLGISFTSLDPSRAPAGWGSAGKEGDGFYANASLGEGCIDSGAMLDALEQLWKEALPLVRVRTPLLVSVTLHELIKEESTTLPLFGGERKNANVSKAMDAINQKFGANTLYTANIHDARQHASGGIAFRYVPNLAAADSVQSRQRAEKPDETESSAAQAGNRHLARGASGMSAQQRTETDAQLTKLIEESL
jgi:DNA polymerase-4